MRHESNEHFKKIAPEVQVKLVRAIRSLLAAGRDCGNVGETLCPQASFGKYEGCYRAAIQSIAVDICRDMNAASRQEVSEAIRQCNEDTKEAFAICFPNHPFTKIIKAKTIK